MGPVGVRADLSACTGQAMAGHPSAGTPRPGGKIVVLPGATAPALSCCVVGPCAVAGLCSARAARQWFGGGCKLINCRQACTTLCIKGTISYSMFVAACWAIQENMILHTLLRNGLHHYANQATVPAFPCPSPAGRGRVLAYKVPSPAVLADRGDPRHSIPRQQIDANKML